MGRSQVERNKTHGRPGTKGRGGGNQGPNDTNRRLKNKQKHSNDLGSNAYRYEKKEKTSSFAFDDDQAENDISLMMENLSSGNEFGLSHYSVASDLLHPKGDSEDPIGHVNHDNTVMDVKSLSQIMENDSSYDYLRFDARMTDMFSKRFANASDKSMTVAESRLCGVEQKQDSLIEESKVIEETDATEEGETLEDFLDDLIGA